MWRVFFFLVCCVHSSVSGCKWVCIDDKNHIIKEYISSSKFKLDFRTNEIEIPDLSMQKPQYKKRKSSEIIPEITLKMPELFVEPRKDTVCSSKKFKATVKEMSKKTRCRPRDSVAEIKYKGSKVVPRQISTKLCSGVCSSAGTKTCLPVETKNVTLTVSVQDSSNRFQCSTIMVPKHTKCRCGCDKTSAECTPNQIFDKQFCKCKCINDHDYQNCMDKISNSNKHEWNKITCSCECKSERVCTTGTDWNRDECRCK